MKFINYNHNVFQYIYIYILASLQSIVNIAKIWQMFLDYNLSISDFGNKLELKYIFSTTF